MSTVLMYSSVGNQVRKKHGPVKHAKEIMLREPTHSISQELDTSPKH